MRSIFLAVVVAIGSGCTPDGGNGAGGGSGGGLLGGGFGGTGGGIRGTGGGATGGGGGGGSVGGGTGGSVGGGTGGSVGGGTGAGIVTFDTFAFYRPAMVSGADGVLHLVFNINSSPSTVQYARCATDCGIGANWAVTIVGSHQFTGSQRLVIGSDNRLHLIYDVSTTPGAAELIYATCASNCTQSASWTKTDLASLFGGGWVTASYGSPLVIDSQGRLSFTVDRRIYLDGGLTLATCASNCSTLGNWSAGKIRSGGTRTALAARGTTLHQLVDNTTTGLNANALSYRTCASNCTQEASWQELPNVFVYDGQMPLAIAVTAQGGVRIVYNQGTSDASQPTNIKAQDNKMLVWGCDSNCLQISAWSGLIMGAVSDGDRGISLAEQGGALVLAISNSNRIITKFCGSNCLLDTSWQSADVDTSAAMTADFNPFTYVGATCSGNPPQSATWHLEQGVVAIRPDGAVAFAHAAHILRTCPNSTSVVYLPGFGRLVYLP